jgi:hypothetical protein
MVGLVGAGSWVLGLCIGCHGFDGFFYRWIPLPVVRGVQKWVTFIMGFALNASEGEVVEGGVVLVLCV